ncbi:hypothetical protein ACQ7DA_15590 [Zafaria sp. J156]|uniref:hypothetical protein n=1 Tax=Zafaria sp. J156 TaxID=3116490 RepID=UPI002E784D81|nr:hypothetical protein [Zafaria sp. J156]MEE1622726.1 hypothetical protein [Zafaria sp. J156]
MDSIRLGDTLSLEDGEYILESISGASLGLRNSRTAERMAVHVSALPALLTTPPNFGPGDPGPRSLERADPEDSERAAILAGHLEEMLYGTPLNGGAQRSDYDPGVASGTLRTERKARELVSGHEKLPIGGHESARWRPAELPAGGHEICPLPYLFLPRL